MKNSYKRLDMNVTICYNKPSTHKYLMMGETRQFTEAQLALLKAAGPGKSYQEAVTWLAEACRLSPATVQRYVRLGVDSFTTAELIARLIGCSIDLLLPRLGAASTRRLRAGRNRKGNRKGRRAATAV